MPIKPITRGGPLSEAHELHITAPFGRAEAEALAKAIEAAARANTVDGRLAPFEGWAKATLKAARLPVDVRDQRWRYELAKLEPYEAPEWFAFQILLQADTIRHDLEAGRSELAVCAAVQLGRLSWAAEVKFAWENHAIRGRKNKSTLEGNRDSYNKQRRIKAMTRTEQAKAVAAKHPALSGGALEMKIAKELGPDPKTGELISLRTVRRHLRGR